MGCANANGEYTNLVGLPILRMDQEIKTSPRVRIHLHMLYPAKPGIGGARREHNGFSLGPPNPSASTLSQTGAAADSYCGGAAVSGTVVAGGVVVAAGAGTTCPAFSCACNALSFATLDFAFALTTAA